MRRGPWCRGVSVASAVSCARRCLAAGASASATTEPHAAASAATGSTATGAKTAPLGDKRLKLKHHPALYKYTSRELVEEARRGDKPPTPTVPKGWTVNHQNGTSIVTMAKRHELDGGSLEVMRIYLLLEVKDPEKTYRQDDGERDENEHHTFSLFLSKPNAAGVVQGGLEFTLTAIDSELILDALTVHSTNEDFEAAAAVTSRASQEKKLAKYRGPHINELDDDFADEVLNYLDDRGINNAFAEFVAAQAYVAEQHEYEYWLHLLRRFAE